MINSATIVRVVSVLVALAVLAILTNRRYRPEKPVLEVQDRESTEAEVKAAMGTIRLKFGDALQRSQRTAKRSYLILVGVMCLNAPFLHGMSLDSHFRPWGQIFTILAGLMLMVVVYQSCALLVLQDQKREMFKRLDEIEKDNSA